MFADLGSVELQMWLAYYPPSTGMRHTNHVHDGSFCSGVYYARTAGPASSPLVCSAQQIETNISLVSAEFSVE